MACGSLQVEYFFWCICSRSTNLFQLGRFQRSFLLSSCSIALFIASPPEQRVLPIQGWRKPRKHSPGTIRELITLCECVNATNQTCLGRVNIPYQLPSGVIKHGNGKSLNWMKFFFSHRKNNDFYDRFSSKPRLITGGYPHLQVIFRSKPPLIEDFPCLMTGGQITHMVD